VSAWPADYAKNDYESTGMHGMFEEIGLPFTQYYILDDRIEPLYAVQLIREASCIFLMGGHPGLQLRFIQEKGLNSAICESPAVIFGVSAGAINMAKRSLDTKESPVPYAGLGLADITVKPHFEPTNQQVKSGLLEISMNLPIYAMEDDSAIFVADGKTSTTGVIHHINKGKISAQ
jgi:peptidase E